MKKIKKKYKKWIILAAAFFSLLIIYLLFSLYFMNHFHFRTTINGKNVTGKSVKQVKEGNEKTLEDYTLVIRERDGTLNYIEGEKINLALRENEEIDHLMENHNGFLWVVKLFRPDHFTTDVLTSYDEEKLYEQVAALDCMQVEKQIMPMNATVSPYVEGEGYTVVEAVEGTAINYEEFSKEIKTSLDYLNMELEMAEGLSYIQPTVFADDPRVKEAVDNLNLYSQTVIYFNAGSCSEVLDATTFSDWFTINENYELGYDFNKVRAYVEYLGGKYDTYYVPKNFMTSYGVAVTIDKSRYGWEIDREAEMYAIMYNILTGEEIYRDFTYSRTAHSRYGNDYGNSYVEINLTSQHLFLYKNGQMIYETDIVSGDIYDGNGTPAGVYGITYLDKNAVLRGDNYATPVTYWMPFNGNVGMHDATWRGKFGGEIYKGNGSHGCINLPYSAAKTIYENVYTGFPVIVYRLPGTENIHKKSQ